MNRWQAHPVSSKPANGLAEWLLVAAILVACLYLVVVLVTR
jgi:hypothetical protein